MSLNRNYTPIHFRKSESKRLRRPRGLLESQKKMSEERYRDQSRMAEPKQFDENDYYELDFES